MSEYISWSPIRRLMKHNGAVIVARDAVDELVNWMGQSAEKLTKTALTLTKHSKRKKVTRDDILLAIKYFQSTDVGGMPEVLGKAGIIVKPEDVRLLEQAIKTPFLNSKIKEQKTKLAKEKIKNYSWENISKRIVQLYEELL